MPQYDDILLYVARQKKRGVLSWPDADPAQPAATSFTYQSKSSNKPLTIAAKDVSSYTWCSTFDGNTLKLLIPDRGTYKQGERPKGATLVRLCGLPHAALAEVEKFVEGLNRNASEDDEKITLQRQQLSTRGLNSGKVEITDTSIEFSIDDKCSFEIPLACVQQAVVQGKHEVGIELLQDERDAQLDGLCEVRFCVPDVRPKRDDEEDEQPMDDEEHESCAQKFTAEVMKRGAVEEGAKAIASFEQLFFNVPRGRYDVDLHATYLKLHNRSYTYKVPFKNISKMFLFDSAIQTQQHLFVIGLDPPVRQGMMSYPYLVVQFDSQVMIEQSFNVDEAKADELYQGLLKPVMKGPMHDVVTRVFKALTGKKVLVPGGAYQSKAGGASVKCHFKANDGQLFCLEKSFFFVKKPPMHIRHNMIESIEFDRVGPLATGSSKTFDLKITTREAKNSEYVFSSIQRDEYQALFDFLSSKLPGVISTTADASLSGRNKEINYNEDAYMNRISAAIDEGEAGGSDVNSSEDEDFKGSDSGSASGSPSSSEGSDMAEEVSENEVLQNEPAKKKKSSSTAGGAKKRTKDANAPKKAISAFMFYSKHERSRVAAAYPELKSSEIASKVGEEWRAATKEVKAKYEAMALEDKARAKAEADEYEANGGGEEAQGDDAESGKAKKRKSTGGAKKTSKAEDPVFTFYKASIGKSIIKSAPKSVKSASQRDKWLKEQFDALDSDAMQELKDMLAEQKKNSKSDRDADGDEPMSSQSSKKKDRGSNNSSPAQDDVEMRDAPVEVSD